MNKEAHVLPIQEAVRICPVNQVSYAPAPSEYRGRGLLGWCRLVLHGNIRVRDVAVRRSADGRLYLAFPHSTTARGERYSVVAPEDDLTREAIEVQVFAALPPGGAAESGSGELAPV